MTERSLHRFSDSDHKKADGSGDDGGYVEVVITHHTPDAFGLRDSKSPRSTVSVAAEEFRGGAGEKVPCPHCNGSGKQS